MTAGRLAKLLLAAFGVSSGAKLTSRDAVAASAASTASSGANPIRKVVTLMETMQAKIEAENKKEDDLYEKFECHCKKTQKQLESDIAKAGAIGSVKPEDIEAKQAQLKALQQSVEDLKNDKIEEEETLAKARAAREKEHQARLKVEKDKVDTEKAAESAIVTLKANETDTDNSTHNPVQNVGSFLSGPGKAGTVFSRQLMAFFQGKEQATPGEATAYIKNIEEAAEETWRAEVAKDTDGAKLFEGVKSSKEKSIKTVLNMLTKKQRKIGDLKVEIVNMKHMMTGGAEQLAENKKMLAELKKDCAQRASEQEEKKVLRAEEAKALQDTIKVLTDDDALDLFRNTIKQNSFLQLDIARQQAREKARRIVSSIKDSVGVRPELSFIALALSGKKVDFTKVFKKIDDMVTLMGKEGSDDESKKEYCNKELDEAVDKSKDLKKKVSELSASLERSQASIEKITADIKSIKEGVQSLDGSVTEATENRKAESAEYQGVIQQDSAAVELLGMAKDRLNQFYNPKLVKETTTKSPYDLSLVQEQKPQVQASNGVLSMIATMISDLEKEMLVAKTEEKNSQEEYEATVADAKEKRAGDLKDAQSKAQIKADLEGDSDEDAQEKGSKLKEQQAAAEYTANLHKECDWLLANFGVRRQAREEEIERLKQAKAVLAGADFS